MKHLLLLIIPLGLFLTACGGEATPDPTVVAQMAEEAVRSTLTAQPTPTPEPTDTPTPTALPTNTSTPTAQPTDTSTPLPTATPIATATATISPSPTATSEPKKPEAIVQTKSLNVRAGPDTSHSVVGVSKQGESLPVVAKNQDGSWLQIQLSADDSGWVASQLVDLNEHGQEIEVAEVIPTPPPAPKQPASKPKTLEVSFLNPHYDCQQREWGSDPPTWGYRSFQADMYIKNNGTEPIEPPWEPSRWIITDGTNDYVNDYMWQWISRRTGFYDQPVIHPGESAGWTYLAFPIERNQWVKAAEFDWNGQTYRQTFDLGTFGNAHNYQDCGDTAPHTVRPTPTPRS